MFLPFRLTWNISLPKARKFGIFMLFGSGWVCIVSPAKLRAQIFVTTLTKPLQLFATLRVVQVGVRNGVPSTPDAKSLQMWAIIETSMGQYTTKIEYARWSDKN